MRYIGGEPPAPPDDDQERRRRRIRYALNGRTRLFAKVRSFHHKHEIQEPTVLTLAGYTVYQLAEWLIDAEDAAGGTA